MMSPNMLIKHPPRAQDFLHKPYPALNRRRWTWRRLVKIVSRIVTWVFLAGFILTLWLLAIMLVVEAWRSSASKPDLWEQRDNLPEDYKAEMRQKLLLLAEPRRADP